MRLVTCLAVAVLAAAISFVAAGGAWASEQDSSYQPTRPLYGGWNLITWTGADSTVGEFRSEIGSVADVLRVSSERPTFSGAPLAGDARLETGDILWVRLDLPTGHSAEWTVETELREQAVVLRAGLNAVGWPGRDIVRGEDLVAAASSALQGIAIWDGESQGWRLALPRKLPPLDPGTRIRTGDAFFVWADQLTTWRRPTGLTTTLVFGDSIGTADRRTATASLAAAEAMLASTFALHPPALEILIVSSWLELATLSGNDQYAEQVEGGCPGTPAEYILVNRSCTLATGVGQDSLGELFSKSIGEGSRHGEFWAVTAWAQFKLSPDPDAAREAYIEESRAVPCTLQQPEACDMRPIWYLWTTYLIERFGRHQLVEFLASPASTANGGYLEVFGTEIEVLLDDFERYRAVVAPPVGATGDRVLISGAEALAEESRIRKIVADVEQFFFDEFGFPTNSRTWRVTSITGTSGGDECGLGSSAAVFIGPACLLAPAVYAHEYFHHMQREWGELTPSSYAGGPEWELEGQATYWEAQFEARAGNSQHYGARRQGWIEAATDESTPALDDPELANAPGFPEYSLGALAAEMLASIAGRHAIQDWYAARVAAYHDTKDFEVPEQRGFRETYGMLMDEFHRQFAEWRAAGFPPLDEEGATP